jgi:hypothetical protein
MGLRAVGLAAGPDAKVRLGACSRDGMPYNACHRTLVPAVAQCGQAMRMPDRGWSSGWGGPRTRCHTGSAAPRRDPIQRATVRASGAAAGVASVPGNAARWRARWCRRRPRRGATVHFRQIAQLPYATVRAPMRMGGARDGAVGDSCGAFWQIAQSNLEISTKTLWSTVRRGLAARCARGGSQGPVPWAAVQFVNLDKDPVEQLAVGLAAGRCTRDGTAADAAEHEMRFRAATLCNGGRVSSAGLAESDRDGTAGGCGGARNAISRSYPMQWGAGQRRRVGRVQTGACGPRTTPRTTGDGARRRCGCRCAVGPWMARDLPASEWRNA